MQICQDFLINLFLPIGFINIINLLTYKRNMEYSVVRTVNRAEYCTVEASSEEEAIETAKLLGEECWEENPNDIYIDYYDYNAELI